MCFHNPVKLYSVWKNNPELMSPSQYSDILGSMTSTDLTTGNLSHDLLNKMMPAVTFSSIYLMNIFWEILSDLRLSR